MRAILQSRPHAETHYSIMARVIVVIFFLLAGCESKRDACLTDSDAECVVSLYSLVANQSAYDGHWVMTTGFYSSNRPVGADSVASDPPQRMLFVDRDSSEYSVLINGVMLTNASNADLQWSGLKPDHYITVQGIFHAAGARNRINILDGHDVRYAGIIEVERLGGGISTSQPYACWYDSPDHRGKYLRELLGDDVCKRGVIRP